MVENYNELVALRTGKRVPQCSGEYWSPEEQEKLQQRFWDGEGISQMALEFGRSEIAIYQQLDKANLLAQQCKPRSRKPKKPAEPRCACLTCEVTSCQNYGRMCPHAGNV